MMTRFMLLMLACCLALTTRAEAADAALPDYSLDAYWTQVKVLPEGASPASKAPPVDVFWVHPTTTRSTTDDNHDPLDPVVQRWTDESAVQRQASAFSACCRIYAPRYRAATTRALADPARREAAFALAYGDIERAFDWYLAHRNNGRPFILAGHSQGGAHVATLVEKRVQGTPLQARLVAAYAVGFNLMAGDFDTRFRQIKPCRTPAQTGCLLQWNAVLAGSDTGPMLAAYANAYAAAHAGVSGGDPVCINPVSFDAARPLSLSAEAKGAAPGAAGLGPMQPLRTGAVAVQCDGGIAKVWLAPGLKLEPLPGGSMHYHDIGLFWADIRANALLRAQAWSRKHHK